MSYIWALLRATAVVFASLAALVVGGLSGTAHADPVPPAPAPSIGQQLVNSAADAPQVLQNLAAALGVAPPAQAAPTQSPSAAIPGLSSLVPGTSSLVPGTSSLVPGTSSLVPGTSSLVPGTSSLVPGATSLVPGTSSLVPGATSLVPGASSPVPGATSLIPGTSSLIPGTAAATPTAGPASLLPTAQISLPQMPFLPLPLPQHVSLPGDLIPLVLGGNAASPAVTQPAAPAVPSNPFLGPLSALP